MSKKDLNLCDLGANLSKFATTLSLPYSITEKLGTILCQFRANLHLAHQRRHPKIGLEREALFAQGLAFGADKNFSPL